MCIFVFNYSASPLHSQSVYGNHHFCLLWYCFVTTATEYLCPIFWFPSFPLSKTRTHTHSVGPCVSAMQRERERELAWSPVIMKLCLLCHYIHCISMQRSERSRSCRNKWVSPPCFLTVAAAGWISFHILSVVRSYQCVTHKPSPFLPWIKIWFHLLSTNV